MAVLVIIESESIHARIDYYHRITSSDCGISFNVTEDKCFDWRQPIDHKEEMPNSRIDNGKGYFIDYFSWTVALKVDKYYSH